MTPDESWTLEYDGDLIHTDHGPMVEWPYQVVCGRRVICEFVNATDEEALLIAAAPDLLKALEAAEWFEDEFGRWCPWCEHRSNEGHAPDCLRQAAIAKATQEE